MALKNLSFTKAGKKLNSTTDVDYYYSGIVPVFNFSGITIPKDAKFDEGTVIISTIETTDPVYGGVASLDLATGVFTRIDQAYFTASQSTNFILSAEGVFRRKR